MNHHTVTVTGKTYNEIWDRAGKIFDEFYGHGKWSLVDMESEAIVTMIGEVVTWKSTITTSPRGGERNSNG